MPQLTGCSTRKRKISITLSQKAFVMVGEMASKMGECHSRIIEDAIRQRYQRESDPASRPAAPAPQRRPEPELPAAQEMAYYVPAGSRWASCVESFCNTEPTDWAKQQGKPSAHQRRLVASQAIVDPRTLERYFAGLSVRSTSAARIEQALATFGLASHIVTPSDGASAVADARRNRK